MHHHFIDRFALGDSPVHRLDARAKFAATLAYTLVLISFDRYAISELVPMVVLPLAMLWFGGIPVGFAVRRVAMLCPFVAMLVLMSPLYDRVPQMVAFGPWRGTLAGGWLTAADILLKFILGALMLTALVCTTRFSLLLEAMRRMAAPKMLVTQLGFLYHYIFVLIDEAMRVRRARDFRGAALAPLGRRIAATGGVIGTLFVRTLERSERIQIAMSARGFRGDVHSLARLRFNAADAAFVTGVALYLTFCRCFYWRWF